MTLTTHPALDDVLTDPRALTAAAGLTGLAGLDVLDQPLRQASVHQVVDALSDHHLIACLTQAPPLLATWHTWHKPIRDPEIAKRVHQPLAADGYHRDGPLAGSVVVTLGHQDNLRAIVLATMRTSVNATKSDSEAYGHGRNQPERLAGPNSIKTEIALFRHFGVPFDSRHGVWRLGEHAANRGKADMAAHQIEIRAIKEATNDPTIKFKDVKPGRWLYVTMPLGPEAYQIRIFGRAPAERLWAEGDKPWWADKNWNPKTGDRTFDKALLDPCGCISPRPGYTGHLLSEPQPEPPACQHASCVRRGFCRQTLKPFS